jgi:hypothetical protein
MIPNLLSTIDQGPGKPRKTLLVAFLTLLLFGTAKDFILHSGAG